MRSNLKSLWLKILRINKFRGVNSLELKSSRVKVIVAFKKGVPHYAILLLLCPDYLTITTVHGELLITLLLTLPKRSRET